jgi:hypothetical protein
MATTLNFLSPANPSLEVLPAASGGFNTIGFYGPGFGLSVRVGEYNETTYRTTEDGQTDGGALPNLRYANTSGAFVASEIVATELQQIDNSEATLRIRLTTDSAVQTQNAKFRTFDKTSIDNAPSGVNVFAAEIIKPSGASPGTGDVNWTQIQGSGAVLSLDDQTTASTEHNFYLALTSTPTSIGEKTNFAMYFEVEFL